MVLAAWISLLYSLYVGTAAAAAAAPGRDGWMGFLGCQWNGSNEAFGEWMGGCGCGMVELSKAGFTGGILGGGWIGMVIR